MLSHGLVFSQVAKLTMILIAVAQGLASISRCSQDIRVRFENTVMRDRAYPIDVVLSSFRKQHSCLLQLDLGDPSTWRRYSYS